MVSFLVHNFVKIMAQRKGKGKSKGQQPAESSNKTYTVRLVVKSRRNPFQNITSEISKHLSKSGIRSGICIANAMDTKSSVFINDHESGLHRDFTEFLEKQVPSNGKYKNKDAAAHIKRQLFGRGVMVAISKGELDFGPCY